MNFSTWYDHGYQKIWEKLGTLKPRTQKPPESLKVRPKNLPYNLKVRPGTPFKVLSKWDPYNDISSLFHLLYFIWKAEKFF